MGLSRFGPPESTTPSALIHVSLRIHKFLTIVDRRCNYCFRLKSNLLVNSFPLSL